MTISVLLFNVILKYYSPFLHKSHMEKCYSYTDVC